MCILLLLFLLFSPFMVHCDDQTKENICNEFVEWDVENNEKMIEVTNEYYDELLEDMVSPNDSKEKKENYERYLNKSKIDTDNFLKHREKLASCKNETILKVLDYYKTKTQVLSKEESKLLEIEKNKVRAFFGNKVEIDGTPYSIYVDLVEYMKQRDYKKLWSCWEQFHDKASAELKEPFRNIVDLENKNSKNKGYTDLADEWLMAEFNDNSTEGNMDQLLRDIFPLFTRVHAFVRHKMFNFYKEKVACESDEIQKVFSEPTNPIPVHILGDLWGQAWTGVGDIVTPFPEVKSINITDILIKKEFNPTKLMKLAESFFTSMGLDKLTDTFWEKSHFEQKGKMNCVAVSYDMKKKGDYRIFMCTKMNDLNFYTAHHEIGHIVNYMLYSDQPLMYKDVAAPSFSEAIGDTIILSARSRKHLEAIGFLEESTESNKYIKKQRINDLMQNALHQVAFLPFIYIIDKWRLAVFRGNITVDKYNKEWWEIRKKYTGISSPIKRPDGGFDIGSKYHVPSLIPFIRYFYSYIGQFEFHEALCKAAGQTTDFDNCDIYNSTEAGNKLREFLSPGLSEPWRVSLKRLTGFENIRSVPLVNYFKVLDDYLKEYLVKNNITVGWEGMWDMS